MEAQKYSRTKPHKPLTVLLKKHSGRDNSGTISVRHQGGRQKRYYRIIDFKRDKRDIEAKVIQIEYDPNRSANIALVEYTDGEKRYILQPSALKVGDTVIAGITDKMTPGNALPLSQLPLGTEIHNVELYPGKGGQIVRSAGSSATIIAKEGNYADIKMPSKEIRKILLNCYATIGRLSRIENKLEKIGKAGRSRLMGIRPTVRGLAMHPGAHPHGGGEGRSSQGMHPKTKWGKPARGKKTRQHVWSDKLIVKSRSAHK